MKIKVNKRFVFIFLAAAVLFSIYSIDSEAVWQSCLDYHQYGYTGVYGQWDNGLWYWYGDGCYDSPYNNYIKKYSCNGASPNYNSGGYCDYGCSNAQCNSPPKPACDANACNGNDDWYDTGSRNWVDIGSCKEKEQKQEVYRDYSCSGNECAYSQTSQRWVDTGSQRDKAGCVLKPKIKLAKSTNRLAKAGEDFIECSGETRDYDLNSDGKVDMTDFNEFKKIFNTVNKRGDFKEDGKVDLEDFFCFSYEFGKTTKCTKAEKIACSDGDRNGVVEYADFFDFSDCFVSASSNCLEKYDHNRNNVIDVNDYNCFYEDVGKSFGNVCTGVSCSTDWQCAGKYHCSEGHCCDEGQYWDKDAIPKPACIGSAEIGETCNCPFKQQEGTGKFINEQGKVISSKEFISNSACWAFNKACVFTKRFSKEPEKRKLDVERRGKK